ncbi:MAG: hypothetical protein RLY93_16325 [Sumerlaeia bacterium]
MITAIEIENFKAVGSPGVRVELRPITLLFGPNSIGKSTVIQALQYAREVLLHGTPNIDRTQLGGDSVDLGGFTSTVHGRDVRRTIKLRLTLDCRDEVFPTFADAEQGDAQETDLRQLMTGSIGFAVGDPSKESPEEASLVGASVEVAIGWDELEKLPRIMSFSVDWDAVPFTRIEARVANTAPAILVNKLHPLLAAAQSGDTEGIAPLADVVTLVEQYLRAPDAPVEIPSPEEWWEGQLETLSPIPQCGRRLTLREIITDQAQDVMLGGLDLGSDEEVMRRGTRGGLVALTAAVLTPLEIVLRHLTPFRYVGPLRRVPDRDFRPFLTPTVARWSDGLAAWDALHLGPISLVARISEWLGGKAGLDTGYYLERREVIELDASRFRELSSRGELLSAIGELETLMLTTRPIQRLSLVEFHTSIKLEPRDLGVGSHHGAWHQPCRYRATRTPRAPQRSGGPGQVDSRSSDR